MEKILYVTDLDGTLLNRQQRVSQNSMEIINALVEKGMLFTYATARSLSSASRAAAGLSAEIPVIVYNGAFIIHPATGAVLSKEGFTKDETEYIIAVLNDCRIRPFVYACIGETEKVSWICGAENEGMKNYIESRRGDKRLRPIYSEEELYQGDMFYVTCIGDREKLRPVYDAFVKDKRYWCVLQQEIYREEYWCEIMPAKATKAEAVQKLKKRWGCDKIVSFGDAVNDIPMFEISEECYAVENAVDELKEIATGIIRSNQEDGVARWLSEHVK